MKYITNIVDHEIELLEISMEHQEKHLISTDTLKERCLAHIDIDTGNDDTEWLSKIGFGQVIQSRLYAHGYRSVRTGFFVNFDKVTDIEYLAALLANAETNVLEKEMIKEQIKKKCDGQGFLNPETMEVVMPMNEEEFMQKIMADAV